MTATPATRKPGSEIIAERFPEARALWSVEYGNDSGSPFTVTAYNINGRVVILQEFGASRGHSWDVYAPVSDSAEIDKTLDALAAIVAGEPVECRTKRCSYFRHYLAYGPAELTHEGFHSAEKICATWQDRADEYFEAHPLHVSLPVGLKEAVAAAEARVRA